MAGHTQSFARSTAAVLLLLASTLSTLPAQVPLSAPEPKSPAAALLLSLGATAVPLIMERSDHGTSTGLFVFAVLAGPAIGHFYAGQPGRALAGIGIRAGILGLMAAGASGGCSNGDFICIPPAVIAGGLFELAAMAFDIGSAPASAHKSNQQRATAFVTQLPGGEHPRLGLGVQVVF